MGDNAILFLSVRLRIVRGENKLLVLISLLFKMFVVEFL